MKDNIKLALQAAMMILGPFLLKHHISFGNAELDAVAGAASTIAGVVWKFWHWNGTPDQAAAVADKPLQGGSGIVQLLMIGAMGTLLLSGCAAPKLEQGGAYAPGATNADGMFVPSSQADLPLFVADSSYKLAYDAIDAVMKFERENRAQLQGVSPKIKTALDAVRPKVVAAEFRWAKARQAYKANPVPANLTTMRQVLAEIQQLVPVVQSQLSVK